jgi:hypothetical protein
MPRKVPKPTTDPKVLAKPLAKPPRQRKPPGPKPALALTKAAQEQICAAVAGGAPPVIAAKGAGIPERTFREWIQRARGEHPTRAGTEALRALDAAIV